MAANSQATAFLSDEWYYWGENPVASNETLTSPDSYSNEYDYYTSRTQGGGWNATTYYTYYRYTTRYRAQYTHTYTQVKYTLTVSMASTGDWVDWSDQTPHNNRRTFETTYGYNAGTFRSKVYNTDNGSIYRITETEQGYYGGAPYVTGYGQQESVTNNNNHMYVIQISSTSATYVLGRPYINATTHQSNDNVVSPAFMIASQLGTVTPFTGNNGPTNAAEHCSRYMEVGLDGTRYTGWRLPTKAEISVITGYQYGTIDNITIPTNYRVMIPVLTGMYYHSLSGERVVANEGADERSRTPSYLRCVRDLSAAEVELLNGFEAIQEKYRNNQ